MKSMTSLSLRHRWVVALAWVAMTIAGVLTVNTSTERMSYSYSTPGQAGYEANQHLTERFGIDGTYEPTLALLHLPAGQTMSTSAGQRTAAKVFAAASRPGVATVADYANTHNPKLIADGGHATWALISLANPDKGPGVGAGERLGPALKAAAPAGSTVALTGFSQLLEGGGESSGPGILVETLIGAAGALIVLLLVYGSAIALVPLLMALPVILVTFLCALGMTYITEVSYFVQYLAALVGLGVAVDYSLLYVVRWREERERGLSNDEAIKAAGATAGRSVLLSGAIVAIGLLSLVVLPVPFLRSIGLGSMLIPIVAIAAATTLLPVTLSAWGPTLDRRRFSRRKDTTYSHAWERWGRAIVRRRWIAGLVGLAVVVALAIPAFSINTAEPLARSLPGGGPATTAFATLRSEGIPSAVVFPIQILAQGGTAGAERAEKTLEEDPGIYTVLAPTGSSFRRGEDAMLTAIPTAEGSTAAGQATVERLQGKLEGGGTAEVAGSTAADLAFSNAVYGNFPLILALVALITLVVLARAFRSVVLAAKAVVLNIISLGAAFGFMVLFWQQGHGSEQIFGIPATGAIRDWIPVVLFAALFGLSMDYEVFVLSRLREEHDRTGSTDEAVVRTLARTGRLVTSAALILAISFISLSTNPNLLVQIIATSLAFGIIVDAVIIRTLLVPAFVSLMGHWNWWMPSPVARLLRLKPREA